MSIYHLHSLICLIISHIKTLIIRCNRDIIIGKKSRLYFKSSIWTTKHGKVYVGKNCLIGRSKRRYHGGMPFYTTLWAEGSESSISIGDNCRINGAYIHAKSSITIGKNCVLAAGITIIDNNGHETYSKNRTIGSDAPSPIKIGNNVWIGMNAIILKGTTIGDNSIISAGSIVKGIFPNNSIICGNPATHVKTINIE